MILIDPPAWPARGRLWSHLVSDVSLAELHGFAADHGLPRRGFERDHYDVPETAYAALVAAGAVPVSAREVVRRLRASGLRVPKKGSMGRRAAGRELLRPPRLRAGDLVAVVSMAGPVLADRLAAGIARLHGWGLRVQPAPHVLDRDDRLDYLAADDAARAADFTAAWLDPEVRAVVLARGGYGTDRALDRLDWRRLAEAEPKVVVGFSDVTALHQAIAQWLGLVTVHGHVVTSLGSAADSSAEALRLLLMEPDMVTDLFAGQAVAAVVGGAAEGVLVGGNLALLAAEVGTPSSRSAYGAIVVLEDVGEEPYRLDRMLTQLLRSGWFEGVRGVVLGAFVDCGDPAAVSATLFDRLVPLGVPMVTGVDLGHTDSTIAVPLGVRARLDADRTTLVLRAPPLT
ncbi:MAG TPA: DUF4031 domain-containing protein [Nocardioidaceae bacterium]|nr:DUF4031 domain-containing protein [Nocardioidaceae bacterium]